MEVDRILREFEAVNLPTKSAIYVWGYNQRGQTARKGSEFHLRIPKRLSPELFKYSGARWLDIACGREHTAAVASDGSLFTWGSNDFGQLGDGTEESREQPKKVKFLQTEFVKSVSCGAHCTAAIAEPRENDGTVSTSRLWVWGQNQGSNYPRLYWGAFSPNTVIRQVSCGSVHVVALSEDGLLQAWGYNEYGQLGRGFTCEGLQGARVLSAYAKFLDEAPELVKIEQVSCGEYHTAAISENGQVYTWGLGSMGQLGHCSLQSGNKELLPRRVVALDGIVIKDIACGGIHTCALTAKGSLYAWGGGQVGQLGVGPHNCLFSCDVNDSDMFLRNIPVMVIPSEVRLVTCGHSHTLITMRDGRIFGWGYNSYGQATNEKSTYAWYPSPVDWCVGEVKRLAAGGGHSAVLTDACSLKDLCEFRLAENVNLCNSYLIEEVASRTGADALARLCGRLRVHLLEGGDVDLEEKKADCKKDY
ncbi:ultraviolet-B receptor UVR8 [Dioscorea cayenensis subsp. rotundata]|uniref:Ultraviolet-B receptor UVR8 n=1 Tax=Dioscorea cayennensis subsp. rotundata TaxID=55577 RepID=A0AB40CL63_DIOCR|nr:ultraviolet-B receptor UVR8 [Dioscorea cayenensis subsp. rotundata]XP_039140108.1 ultraviolet-B receptor UVR8 [Dioscorea cayenensis subsp. rotundata]XP_039140109.1 ultraviolet-B receptor UVR8 [Dioscorea cayenensis subsp. rotundata]